MTRKNQDVSSAILKFCCITIFSIALTSCSRYPLPINNIPDVGNADSSIMVKNWLFKAPYLDIISTSLHDFENRKLNKNEYSGDFLRQHEADVRAINPSILSINNSDLLNNNLILIEYVNIDLIIYFLTNLIS